MLAFEDIINRFGGGVARPSRSTWSAEEGAGGLFFHRQIIFGALFFPPNNLYTPSKTPKTAFDAIKPHLRMVRLL